MSDQPYTPSAHQLANFDQMHAEIGEKLDSLIDTHRTVLAEPDLPREVNIIGICQWIVDNVEPAAMAELLAVAVDRLTALDGGQ